MARKGRGNGSKGKSGPKRGDRKKPDRPSEADLIRLQESFGGDPRQQHQKYTTEDEYDMKPEFNAANNGIDFSSVKKLTANTMQVTGRTENQKNYIRSAFENDITFCLAPAGTGKTFIAAYIALEQLKQGLVERIIITRPTVGSEDNGFLPGNSDEKMAPWMAPVLDHFVKILGDGQRDKGHAALKVLRDKSIIEILPFQHMRGTDIENTFVIGDELQNVTHEQMKMLLTRIGDGSKMLLVGDPDQTDLSPVELSGFAHAATTIRDANIEGIAVAEMGEEDVIRHPLIGPMLTALKNNPPPVVQYEPAPTMVPVVKQRLQP